MSCRRQSAPSKTTTPGHQIISRSFRSGLHRIEASNFLHVRPLFLFFQPNCYQVSLKLHRLIKYGYRFLLNPSPPQASKSTQLSRSQHLVLCGLVVLPPPLRCQMPCGVRQIKKRRRHRDLVYAPPPPGSGSCIISSTGRFPSTRMAGTEYLAQ